MDSERPRSKIDIGHKMRATLPVRTLGAETMLAVKLVKADSHAGSGDLFASYS
jgi:hypothetical protein